MLIEEMLEDGRVRHYSDQDMRIRQIETNKLYNDAVDVVPCKYTYEETDIPIEHKKEPSPVEPSARRNTILNRKV